MGAELATLRSNHDGLLAANGVAYRAASDGLRVALAGAQNPQSWPLAEKQIFGTSSPPTFGST